MSDNPSDDTPTVDPLPPLGDMDPAAFRRAGHQLVDWISRYLENSEQYPVLSRARPGQSRDALPTTALSTDPVSGELHRRHHVGPDGYYRGHRVIPEKEISE